MSGFPDRSHKHSFNSNITTLIQFWFFKADPDLSNIEQSFTFVFIRITNEHTTLFTHSSIGFHLNTRCRINCKVNRRINQKTEEGKWLEDGYTQLELIDILLFVRKSVILGSYES